MMMVADVVKRIDMGSLQEKLAAYHRRKAFERCQELLSASTVLAVVERVDDEPSETAMNRYRESFLIDAQPDQKWSHEVPWDDVRERLSAWEHTIASRDNQTLFLYIEEFVNLAWIIVRVHPGWLADLWTRLRTRSFAVLNADTQMLLVFSDEEHNILVFGQRIDDGSA